MIEFDAAFMFFGFTFGKLIGLRLDAQAQVRGQVL